MGDLGHSILMKESLRLENCADCYFSLNIHESHTDVAIVMKAIRHACMYVYLHIHQVQYEVPPPRIRSCPLLCQLLPAAVPKPQLALPPVAS